MAPVRTLSLSTPAKRGRFAAGKTKGRKAKTTFRKSLVANPIDFGRYSLPLRCKNLMRYSSTTNVTLDVTGTTTVTFRANGMFDPEFALGGHQPLYFDQMSALYNHYHVVVSNIHVRVQALSGSALANLYIDDDATPNGTGTTLRERPGAKTWLVAQDTIDHGRKCFWSAQQTFGGNAIDNDELKGTGSNDPSEQSFFIFQLTNGVLDQEIKVYADIEFTVVWSELKSIGQS